MKTLNITRRILLVGIMALTLGSCQDDFKSPSGLTGNSIAAAMAADANFTLWTAVTQRVGMYASLNNPNSGLFTIFAPSDPAMTTYLATTYAAQLPVPVTEASLITFIDGLSTTSNPTLASFTTTVVPVLNYHIVSSKITSSQITGTQTFATLNSARLSISKVGSTVVLNGNSATNGATVTNFDLQGSNGVAHTIDRVMAVPGVATVLSPLNLSISYATNPPTVTGGTSSDAIDSDFDLLAALIRYTGLTPTILPNSSPLPEFTIFQANDGIIRAYLLSLNGTLTTEALCYTYISTLTPASVTAPTLADLTTLVKYHVVPGRYLVQDLTEGLELTTLLTTPKLTAGVAAGPPTVYTIKDANTGVADPVVTSSNILTNSGVLHTINGVLRPN
ncbi:MAG: fasciclin domain-containing protein [Cyclobacteriaceae bacterium]|nr:fasciclin domain-containing protein [Cyclobacteriaceae bacterium]